NRCAAHERLSPNCNRLALHPFPIIGRKSVTRRQLIGRAFAAGFHRIRYYGLLASGKRAENIARARELLMPPIIPVDAIKAISPNAAEPQRPKHSCPCCGGRMITIERFERGATPHYRPIYQQAKCRIPSGPWGHGRDPRDHGAAYI